MARFYPSGGTGGGGLDTSKLTATAYQLLAGFTGGVANSDEPVSGTMPDRCKVDPAVGGINSSYPNVAIWKGDGFQINATVTSKESLLAFRPPYGYYNGSYVGATLPQVASVLGITSAKVSKGNTIAGVAGDAWTTWTGGASAVDGHVLKGETFWREGVKHTGTMTVSSVVSFSVAPYSTSQVIATWRNPSKGPYSTFVICAKTGGYPTSDGDSRVYVGGGNNGALNATNSITIGGLAAGKLYYFRIWVSVKTSAGWITSSGYLQTTCTPTAHGRASFTASGTFTVPNGVRSIRLFGVGGGGSGGFAYDNASYGRGGDGGGSGFTKTTGWISVSPGAKYNYTIGAGHVGSTSEGVGGTTSFGSLLSVLGGLSGNYDYPLDKYFGGSGPGYAGINDRGHYNGGKGGSNGGHGNRSSDDTGGAGPVSGGSYVKIGQGTTTRAFGVSSGELYSGAGAGGNSTGRGGRAEGGAGGGGFGGLLGEKAGPGSNGTGGGGGGARGKYYNTDFSTGGNGGSGIIIVEW